MISQMRASVFFFVKPDVSGFIALRSAPVVSVPEEFLGGLLLMRNSAA